jgi:peptidyl-prolyl cis-trans isomerase C
MKMLTPRGRTSELAGIWRQMSLTSLRSLGVMLLFSLAACSPSRPPTIEGPLPTSITAGPNPTIPPPTATSIPVAAIVNGQTISLEEYQAELGRFESGQASLGIELATLDGYQGQVLQVLIDRALLVQGALAAGFTVDKGTLATKLAEIIDDAGGQVAFEAWLTDNGFTAQTFTEALRKDALASLIIEQVSGTVSTTGEQAHARHILLFTREEAEEARAEILAGANFEDIAWARSLDPSTRLGGGDLGWFPRGFLTQPEVEEAAFSLELGEISPVIESALGFHVIEVLARETRPLSPAALQAARGQALSQWLAEQRASAEIEIRVTP